MQGAQSLTCDVLRPRFELLEGSKCLRLVLKEIDCVPTFPGPCTSQWTSCKGLEALDCEVEKGFVCIFPALQASHTGSGSARESSLKPVTRLPDKSFLTPAIDGGRGDDARGLDPWEGWWLIKVRQIPPQEQSAQPGMQHWRGIPLLEREFDHSWWSWGCPAQF